MVLGPVALRKRYGRHRRGGHADPAVTGDEPEWTIAQIIGKRIHGRGRRLRYLVWWKGFPTSESTWEDAASLRADGCQESIDDYEHRPT